MLVLLRAASGLFAGAAIPLMMAYLGDVVPYAERQITIGRFLTGMVMAQMLTGPVAGVIGEHAGWRSAFLVLGVLSIAIGLTLAAQLGPRLWRRREASGAAVPGMTAYLSLLSHPVGRWLLISAFFDGLCLFGGAFPYVGAFVIQEFGLTTAAAGLLVAGFGVGSFLYTRFARVLVRRLGEGVAVAAGRDRPGRRRRRSGLGADLAGGRRAANLRRPDVLHVPRRAAGPRHRGLA